MSKNKSYQIWLPILLALCTIVGIFIGKNINSSPSTVIQIEENGKNAIWTPSQTGQIEEVLRYIEARYVDKVDRDELVEKAIDNLLEELDPHSKYIPARDLQAVNESLGGNLIGIGVEFDILNDSILVVRVLPDGPSAQAGIKAGDRIVMINDSIAHGEHIDTEWVIKHLKGKKDTEVKLTIQRPLKETLDSFNITRDKVTINSLDIAMMLDEKTAYIKINRFSDHTYKEFMDAMSELQEKNKVEDLVIDLRQNPGGYLNEATRILNQLIKEQNVMLVYTEGEHSVKKEHKTMGSVKYNIDDIGILIDEGSASSSEIVAGALQDNDRAIIVGRRSFGKGLVQEQYNLSHGAALRLTVAKYYTKSGRLIQKAYKEGYEKEMARYDSGELESADSIHITDSTKYYTQNGRLVYGGSGIIPDIFVPMDTLYKNQNFIHAASRINSFVYQLLDHKRTTIQNMGLDAFIKDYNISSADWNNFITHATKGHSSLKKSNIKVLEIPLKRRIKSTIAKNVFGLKGYFKMRNLSDPVLLETMKILDNSESILQTSD